MKLPISQSAEIKDADGNVLHQHDRVYAHDFDGKRMYGTLIRSEEPETMDEWCIEYDDGECYLVLDFKMVWKA